MNTIKIHPDDNVVVALDDIAKGDVNAELGLTAQEAVATGHKLAIKPIKCGEAIVKYGCAIGTATCDIQAGEWVHTHNTKTTLTEAEKIEYNPSFSPLPQIESETFDGFLRKDGRAGVRNEIWILPTVGCVNSIAQQLARDNQQLVGGSVEGIFAFPHPYGCSQLGDDHEATRKILVALAKHPNTGGVLLLGLGCENLTAEQLENELGDYDKERIKILICQQCEDELAEGTKILSELAKKAGENKRQPIPISKLVVGMKCGGSDGLSGITANSAVGRFTNQIVSRGGTSILTEVPEMFGAESILFNRCVDEDVFKAAEKMVEDYKAYFVANGQTVYENPSPGNKAGGITTLEDKSCGCVQKGGDAPVTAVLGYGDTVQKTGLNLLYGPGNDLVSTTALTAAGANIILFTTGRGTPFGAPVPTLKISSNSALYKKKKSWIDFDAGVAAEGVTVDELGQSLFELVKAVASGKKAKNEINGCREIAIFKNGITL